MIITLKRQLQGFVKAGRLCSEVHAMKTEPGTAARIVRIRSGDSDFQLLETLKTNRQKRHRTGLFIVEGVRAINLALQNGWRMDALVYSSEQRLSDWASGVLDKAGTRVTYELSGTLMAELSDKDDPSELIAVVEMRPDDLMRIRVAPDLLLVACDRPANPGNLGTIIRSCDAFGANGLVIVGHAADLYDPQTIRATTGSFFSVPSVRLDSQRVLMEWTAEQRLMFGELQLVGTSAKADTDISALDFRRPTILVLGNETHGLSYDLKQACDQVVRIPIGGTATSLNLACAASIMLYEVTRQRKPRGSRREGG